jgi:hypothetical protein
MQFNQAMTRFSQLGRYKARSLWGVACFFLLRSVRINILGNMPWCGHLLVGETIDIFAP